MVRADFAQAFRGVVNQASEAEDVVNTAVLGERTAVALTGPRAFLSAVMEWREKTAGQWAALAERAEFVSDATDEALRTFADGQTALERKCLG